MTKPKIIVVGHGNFASGICSSLELFVGPQNKSNFIDFTKEMNEDDLAKKINEQVSNQEIIFFTDLVGGTPYKLVAELAYHNDQIGVVAGCNLSSLLETTYRDYHSKEELMHDLVAITQKTAQVFDKTTLTKENQDKTNFSDGI